MCLGMTMAEDMVVEGAMEAGAMDLVVEAMDMVEEAAMDMVEEAAMDLEAGAMDLVVEVMDMAVEAGAMDLVVEVMDMAGEAGAILVGGDDKNCFNALGQI
eukprot:GFUD01088802.1.p3 GENE.GFUD01088802.1~~GFUD01088802.1.p3  ORF type:complete len:101 (-),score=29.68 GFUD01088802.1:15-317(-)